MTVCTNWLQDGDGGGEECGGQRVNVYINTTANRAKKVCIGTWCKYCGDIKLHKGWD